MFLNNFLLHFNENLSKFLCFRVLKISKIHPSEIDAIAIEGITTGPFPKAWQQYPGFSDMFFQWSWINKNSHGISLLNSYNNNFSKISKIKNLLKQLEIPLKKIIFVEHHLAHAASAYYLSPWNLDEEVLVFTADSESELSKMVSYSLLLSRSCPRMEI